MNKFELDNGESSSIKSAIRKVAKAASTPFEKKVQQENVEARKAIGRGKRAPSSAAQLKPAALGPTLFRHLTGCAFRQLLPGGDVLVPNELWIARCPGRSIENCGSWHG